MAFLGALRAAVIEVAERVQSQVDDLTAASSVHVDDERDTAGVVLVIGGQAGVVGGLGAWWLFSEGRVREALRRRDTVGPAEACRDILAAVAVVSHFTKCRVQRGGSAEEAGEGGAEVGGVVGAAQLAGGVHRQLRSAEVGRADAELGCGERTDRRAARQVGAVHETLERDPGVTTGDDRRRSSDAVGRVAEVGVELQRGPLVEADGGRVRDGRRSWGGWRARRRPEHAEPASAWSSSALPPPRASTVRSST